MASRVSSAPKKWRDLFSLLPGYDPIATAGDCWFDAKAAENAIEFIEECCRHVKGELAGTPLVLQDWQRAFVGCLFGWKRTDGTRRYREALLYIPRKNGKTALAAAIVCLVLFTDQEPGAECYSAAAEREQARLCFEPVVSMIRAEPEMNNRAKIFKYAVTVGDSSYKAISAEAGSKHGFNTHLLINDELHVHRTSELTDVLLTSMGARKQPLAVHLTTADYHRPESVCNLKHDYASKVRDGILPDQSFLPVIYQASPDDDWQDEATWAKANPNLGVSIDIDYLRRECRKAIEQPTYENTFKRLHLNIITEQDVRFLQMEKWDKCHAEESITPQIVEEGGYRSVESLVGQVCCAGLDLSTTTDLTCLSLVFPQETGYRVLPFFFAPRERAIQREKRDRVPYLTWARQGFIELTEGDVVDYGMIRRRINELREHYDIREIACDRWNAAQIIQDLGNDGFTMVEFGQGMASMSGPTKELEKQVIAGTLDHGSHPVLRWNASNVTVEKDAADNYKPNKAKSTGRIDGIVATIMGLDRSSVYLPQVSFYDTNELEMA